MASNGLNTSEDANMSVCDGEGENVVTMMDVLQEQEKFEEDANAVLGASDDKNCTYAMGYVKRQAIYACLTCCPDAKTDPSKRAGFCLACSLNCHENHELVELYTKRNFRCDCGNPKFNSHPCQFNPNKSDLNYENKYNQNFSGVYCVCHRPYPDPEATEEEEMIQCIVCEDWLHEKHLEATVPYNDQYAEMICKECMEDNDFLHDYSDLVINTADKLIIHTDPDLDVDITSISKSEDVNHKDSVDEKPAEPVTNQSDEVQNKTHEQNIVSDEKSEEQASGKDEEEKKQDSEQNEENKDDSKDDTTVPNTENDKEEQLEKDDSAAKDKAEESDKLDPEAQEKLEEERLLQDDSELKDNAEKQNGEVKNGENVPEHSTGDESNKEQNRSEPETAVVTSETANETPEKEAVANGNTNDVEMEDSKDPDTTTKDETSNSKEIKRKLSTEEIVAESLAPKKAKIEEKCIRQRRVKRVYKGATFWPATLRQKLCSCGECISMYKDLAVLFLIDQNDTVTAYEALGKENTEGGPSSQYERGLQALSSLDRVQQINALTEYNKMKDKLLDFLKSFKDRKEIVKEEDIKAFFAGLKPKREPDGVYFCR